MFHNSLRHFRESRAGGKLSLREAGEGMGIPWQTLAKYETQEGDLPADVLEKAANFYDVSIEEIKTRPPGQANEDAPAYRINTLPVDLLPIYILEAVEKFLLEELGKSAPPKSDLIMDAMRAVKHELHNRPEPAHPPPPVDPEKARMITGAESTLETHYGKRGAKPKGEK